MSSAPARLPPIEVLVADAPDALRTACSACNLRELCLPIALSDEELDALDALVDARRRVLRGEMLFRADDAFGSLHAVRVGFFKSVSRSADGRDQVMGFHMAGELLGLDGIGTGRHNCDAVALEDSEVCVIAFPHLESMARRHVGLQRQFHRLMSRELIAEHDAMLRLGGMQADERVAAFLVNLMTRLRARGSSGASLRLRMSREEIGSYLGLTFETVSRVFSALQRDGVLTVDRRAIEILDETALRARTGRAPC